MKNCPTGKVRHKSKIGAIIAAKKLKNSQLNPYRCKQCGGWHLGNSNHPLRRMDRINQLLDQVMKGKES